jgi:DNA polymerase IIIc chi subunit
MAEVLFYHLQHQPLEAVLPTLLQKSLERGWRAVVQVTTEERMSALDDHLWTFADESFLPHGTDREAHGADQPILITLGAANPNGASIRFLRKGPTCPRTSPPTSGWRSCSTAPTCRLSPSPATNGARSRRAATTPPTGSRTSAGAGSARRDALGTEAMLSISKGP